MADRWENIDKARRDSAHYSIMRAANGSNTMAMLRDMFPNAKADDLNFVLFSTSGVHGHYGTIEDVETHLTAPTEETICNVTFVVVQPRLVALRYGNCTPETKDDIDFLKRLRASSHEVVAKIGEASHG
jgi:hypothetical protein